jgi:hypothetical protein
MFAVVLTALNMFGGGVYQWILHEHQVSDELLLINLTNLKDRVEKVEHLLDVMKDHRNKKQMVFAAR